MPFLMRAIWVAASTLVLAITICVLLVIQRDRTSCTPGSAPCPLAFHISLPFFSRPPVDSVGSATNASTTGGCAVFGATLAGCQSYPGWTSGTWGPPPHVTSARVLLVGGGAGGGASGARGMGGGGGGSGQVISGPASLSGNPIFIAVGTGGGGGQRFYARGDWGQSSFFGGTRAAGGQGGESGGAGGNGYSGGGGAGGGTYDEGNSPGDGGDGGMGGQGGMAGQNGGNPGNPVLGGNGGNGASQSIASFSTNYVTAGGGGGGGAANGTAGSGCGGGGGGGGGGVLLDGQGLSAMSGQGVGATDWPCRGNEGFSGGGGIGYGAGGGGGGNYAIGDPGGNGAQGVVYVEW